jgi:hypothetical protein
MKNKLRFTRSLTLVAIVALMMMPGLGWGQTQLAVWTFDATAAAPSTPSSVAANLGAQSGTATLYADGTNGSSIWITATVGNELTAFAGSTVNDPRGTPIAGQSYCPVGGTGFSANGKSMVIKFTMTGFQDPIIKYATRNTSTGFQTQTWAWSTDNSTYTNFGTITTITTSFVTKTLDMNSINSLDQATAVYLRVTFTGATSTSGNNRLDNIVINATAASAGGPTKLAITSINGGTSPSTGTPFNVVVQSQDGSSVPANVAADTYFTLSLAAGTGAFGGTLTGSIAAGSNSATVTGITYNTAEAGVSLTATQTSGDILTPGTSSTFAVLGAADHLAFVNVPLYALVATNLNAFTVEARRADNTVDANYVSNITLVKASGAGNLSGTTVKAAVAGIATFNDLQIDAADIYTLTATSGALTSATSGNIEIVGAITAYRSKISGNWNNITTWEAYTGTQWINAFDYPVSASKDVTIRSGHLVTVPISYNLGTAKNLTIESGATLYANSSSGSCFVYVYGDILNDGTIGGATDVIGFDIEGTSCQLSGSGTFIASRIAKFTTTNATTNLIFNQNVTLTYTSASAAALRNGQAATTTLNITLNSGKQLTVSNAKIDLTGCTLILKSGSSLLDIGAFLGMSGTNVTVERAIAGGEWHFISAPVSDAVSGLFTGKFLQKNTESTNAFTDIESVTEALTPAKGFALYNATDFTAQYTGTLNTGAIGSADNVTRSATGDFSGWNLVGNPYPSSIDWNASSGWTKTNLNNATYIHLNASNWASYVGGVGSNGGSQFIASGQGFFVNVASVGNGTLTMNNNIRVHNATPFYKSAVSNLVRLQVSGQGFTDEAIVRFAANATAGFDGDYDAYKLFGDVAKAAQLYTLGSTPLAINTMPETSTVPVGIHVGASGTYTIAATEINDFTKVTLEDTKTAVFTDMLTTSYTFNFVPGENEQRFVLHFGPLAVNETESSSANIYSYRQTVYVNMKDKQAGDIYIYNIAGQVIATKMSAKGMNEIGLNQTGNYIVKVISRDNTVVRKVFIN